MAFDMNLLKQLREETKAGIMDVKKSLELTEGDLEKARTWLQENAIKTAEKKSDRETSEGIIGSYVHTTGKVAGFVALTCETDFVARTDDFKHLAREVAMQIASMDPQSIDELVVQPYIRDPKKTIQDMVKETAGKVGENIVIKQIARMAI